MEETGWMRKGMMSTRLGVALVLLIGAMGLGRPEPIGVTADPTSLAAVVAQVDDGGVDPDRPLPPRRDDALDDGGSPVLWIVAAAGIAVVLGGIAWLSFRGGRAFVRSGRHTSPPSVSRSARDRPP